MKLAGVRNRTEFVNHLIAKELIFLLKNFKKGSEKEKALVEEITNFKEGQ